MLSYFDESFFADDFGETDIVHEEFVDNPSPKKTPRKTRSKPAAGMLLFLNVQLDFGQIDIWSEVAV